MHLVRNGVYVIEYMGVKGSDSMNDFLNMISDIRVVIAIAVIVVVLLGWLIVARIRTSRSKKELEDLEKRYNDMKSIPVSFKMNKAVTISRVDSASGGKVDQAKESFDRTQVKLTRISEKLADAEDSILVGKLRKADEIMTSLESEINLASREINDLNVLLDDILARETAQRQEVNTLKNRFRALKSSAQDNSAVLSFCWSAFEQKISTCEKQFSAFEEWMFSSDYDKANAELGLIHASLDELEEMITEMPGLLNDARGVIPNMAETLHKDYKRARNRGVFLTHLNVESKLKEMTEDLKKDLQGIKEGKTFGVRGHLDVYKEELKNLDDSVKQESEYYDELKSVTRDTEKMSGDANGHSAYVNQVYNNNGRHLGFSGLGDKIAEQNHVLQALNDRKPKVLDNVRMYQMPASEAMADLKQLYSEYSACNANFKAMRESMDSATGDENRAKKQLVKLQVIMNQMQVKIREHKLPSISQKYEEDMNQANEYIHRLETLMSESPLNIQLLNGTLQEAVDFIYKLYNNVTNIVGMTHMLENTIVFGNRYRSTYPDIDSELTRSELCFRNGEYTQALNIAIATIEKIHPGNYESMIKENAKGAE